MVVIVHMCDALMQQVVSLNATSAYFSMDHHKISTVEPHYNEDLGTMEITLLYQVSPYIRVKKQGNIRSWDQ